MKDGDREVRVRLAARILFRKLGKGQPPVTLEEIAQLRFLAETEEEREMPIEKLAQAVIGRELRGKAFRPPESPGDRRN
jgi:hypothetical protein